MTDKQQCTYPKIGLLIDGEWIYDREALCDVENPSDESILGQVPKATARDLQNALESSARGFETWRRTPPTARAAVMRRAAALVRERAKTSHQSSRLNRGGPTLRSGPKSNGPRRSWTGTPKKSAACMAG